MRNAGEGAARKVPNEYFDADEWPYGPAQPGTPIAALHAAELAVGLLEWALRNDDSLLAGLHRFAKESALPIGTLRHLAAGDRWPGLDTVAQIDWALGYSASSVELVGRRLVRDGGPSVYVFPPAAHHQQPAQSPVRRGRSSRP